MTSQERRPRAAGRAGSLVAWFGLILVAATTANGAGDPPSFELKDGDRVVFLGGTFIEREGSYGTLETLLTAPFPDRSITFRNLGWSGDTVWGEARSRFGPAAEGFAHLKEHVEALKPTVLFVQYGQNESFAGKPGLPRFEAGLNTLLDVLDATRARVVLITPRRLEDLGRPLPDPAQANAAMADYVAVLRKVAGSRGYRLVDLYDGWKPEPGHPLTDNGVHLTAEGYREAARAIGKSLGLVEDAKPARLMLSFLSGGSGQVDSGFSDMTVGAGPFKFRYKAGHLPGLASTVNSSKSAGPTPTIGVVGYSAGRHRVGVDGQTPITIDDITAIPLTAELAQVEALRAAIVAKNQLYFYRWRPQNETYLFGFRKHEQGNNAREIPLFDPLVSAKEAEIARLRVPEAHTYEIFPAKP